MSADVNRDAIIERAVAAGLRERKRLIESTPLLVFASRSVEAIQRDIIIAAVREALRAVDELGVKP